ncbi:5-oxoprolinase subunit PxpB [Pseudoxanthomonas dokdonensis]|uniref:Carboxyltransferase domain-containing protein n=1 Tax=Pseudoxanthomonas dokdonensis TaxID=344882 RepID=A0A0R0CUG7_9GAMM|nr:5-oxoprolinase subunit PxpB [Pseudoxanthomonas dokdonensis]KRG68915.1 hypothetical protein ABB29_10615 [Pseudoxanthomonas dokdonensis]
MSTTAHPVPDFTAPSFTALADDALLLQWGQQMDPIINARVHALVARIRRDSPAWLRDCVPAYASLAIFFDIIALGADAHHQVQTYVAGLLRDDASAAAAPTRSAVVRIPVCYHPSLAPDLETSAQALDMSVEELIERHSQADYRVAMIGFAPGFPYLSGLPENLALPRLATPRARVEAGSVAIGGNQTGIYPLAGPGGWRILGRTPLRLFDPRRQPPSLLVAGNQVRFVAISLAEFQQHKEAL